MKKNLRKKIITCAGIFLGTVMLALTSFVPSMAAETEKVSFQTQKQVMDAADGYFILQDETTKKYGLCDGEGKIIISCEYDEMSFPEDTMTYDYLVVKQGSNWGIINYDGTDKIDVKYNSVSPYMDGRKVATAYDGKRTLIFNDKGSQVGVLMGEYIPISNDVFKGEEYLKTRKDAEILSLSNQKLLFQRRGTDAQISNIYQLGKNIVADYNVGSANTPSLDENYGKISTYRYIRIFQSNGQFESVTPDPTWTKGEKEMTRGGIRLEKVISDHSFIVRLMGYKENYLAIYDAQKKEYSELFLNISDFYDNKAFAADEDGKLYIIDQSGKKVSKHEVKIPGYERLGIKQSKHDPFIIFKRENDEIPYKLYCLKKNMAVQDSFKTVTFRRNEDQIEICHGLPLVCNENNQYTILTREGEPIFDYGLYKKEDLVNHTFYSDTNVTVVSEEDGVYQVTSYQIEKPVRKSVVSVLFQNVFLIKTVIGIIVIVLLIWLAGRTVKTVKARKKRARTVKYRRKIVSENPQIKHTGSENTSNQKDRSEALKETTLFRETMVEETRNRSFTQRPRRIVAPTLGPKKFYGQLNCLTGEYSGAKIAMQDLEWIRIGRDESDNDLVMSKGTISRKHCAVHYDSYRHIYYVIDYSRNGVFLENGSRLPYNEEVSIEPGSKIYLGDNRTIIELARDPSL